MMREIKINGSTYNLGEMSDEEVAAWLKERAATDAVMERLDAKYAPDEIAALGTEQIREEIQGMDNLLISVQSDERVAKLCAEPSPPPPVGILAKMNQRKK